MLSFGARAFRSFRVVGSAAASRRGIDISDGVVLGLLGGVLVGVESEKEGWMN
jgi:hypothetical protein